MRALVTGANRGIGLALVRGLLAAGGRVAAACRHPGRASTLTALAAAHPGRLHVLPLDLQHPASVAELAREVGLVFDALDLLINAAGVLVPGERFGQVSAEALERSLRVNAVGPFVLAQACAALLQRGESPCIANLSSEMGSLAGVREFRSPSYAMSKAALNMASVQLARALAAQGIRVLALHPGWVRTDMGGAQAPLEADESAAGLLATINSSTLASSGRFLDWQGRELAW